MLKTYYILHYASIDEIHKSTLFDNELFKIRAIFSPTEPRTTLASHDTRERKGDEFRGGRRDDVFRVRDEEKWVVSQRTIVARRERSLRTPSSYPAEHGPR